MDDGAGAAWSMPNSRQLEPPRGAVWVGRAADRPATLGTRVTPWEGALSCQDLRRNQGRLLAEADQRHEGEVISDDAICRSEGR